MSRRGLLIGSLLLASGCARAVSDVDPYWATLRRIAGSGGKRDRLAQIRQRALDLPYATLEVSFRGSLPALLVLQTINADGSLDWVTTSNQLLSTRGAFVTRMLGFEIDLVESDLPATAPGDLRQLVGRRETRIARFRADRDVQIVFSSSFAEDGSETVPLLAGDRLLTRIEEKVSADGRVRFSNRYWVDPATGFCWKSEQTPIPTLPAVRLRVLKAPTV